MEVNSCKKAVLITEHDSKVLEDVICLISFG